MNRRKLRQALHFTSTIGLTLSLSACPGPQTPTGPAPAAGTPVSQLPMAASPTSLPSSRPASAPATTPPSQASSAPIMAIPQSPIQVQRISRTQGPPAVSITAEGQGLDQIERIALAGLNAEILTREGNRLVFRLPEASLGIHALEFFAHGARLTAFNFELTSENTAGSGGGGGGGGGGGTQNPAPPSSNPNPGTGPASNLPAPITDSRLVLELPLIVMPPGLSDFAPVAQPDQGHPRVNVPSMNQSTTVLMPSEAVSSDNTGNQNHSLPQVVGLGLQEEASFHVQTAFDSSLDPVFAYQGGSLPANADLRAGDTAIRNQGSRGTCTFHAWAGLMDYLLKQASFYQGPSTGLSPQYLSWLYQEEVEHYQSLDDSPVYGQMQVQFSIHTDDNGNNPDSYRLLETRIFPNDSNLQANIDQAVATVFQSSAWLSWAQQGVHWLWWTWQPIQTGTAQTLNEGSSIQAVGELIDANSPAKVDFTGNQGTVTEGFVPYPVPTATPIPASDRTGSRQQRAQHIMGSAIAQRLASYPVPVKKLRTFLISKDINSLKAALSQGKPLVIGMPTFVTSATADVSQDSSASPWNMQNRSSLDAARIDARPPAVSSNGNHAVLLIGYRDQAGAPGGGYFIVRNSWGTSWGYMGYALISYDYIYQYAFAPMTADLVPYSDLQSSVDIAENGSQMLLQLQNLPSGTQHIALDIRASDLDPLVSVTPYRSAGQLATEYRINVPPGTGRKVTISAYGAENQLLGRVELANQSISINEKKTLTLSFNSLPVISAATAQPASLAGGSHTTLLNCTASDPGNAPLTYSWSTVGGAYGTFSAPGSAQTFWTAPTPAAAAYTLRCSVNNGTQTSTRDINLVVANGSGTINGTGGFH